MRFSVTLALLVAAGLSACANTGGNPENSPPPPPPLAERQADDPAKTANDSAEELGEFIRLPFEPVEVEWRDQSAAGDSAGHASAGRRIVAVMRFTSEHSDRIAAEAAKLGAASTTTIETEEWYPEELIAHSELNGDSGLAATVYRADSFYQPPFSSGKLTRIDGTDYFVLELFSN